MEILGFSKNRTIKKRQGKIAWLLLLLSLIVFIAGTIDAGGKYSILRLQVIRDFFNPSLVEDLKADSLPIIEKFHGINVFSTSQYGRVFIMGEVDIYDVFDARIPGNQQIFQNFAHSGNLMQDLPDSEYYSRYAQAGIAFLREYDYDAVLYFPDEFHPLFTNSHDCWIFVRDEPIREDGEKNRYISGRLKNRKAGILGGVLMKPLDKPGFYQFYIPSPGEVYEPFRMAEDSVRNGSSAPEKLNPYIPGAASKEIIKKRRDAGITPSPLSCAKNIPVGYWVSKDYSDTHLNEGYVYSGSDKIYTWSDCGIYLIPLDKTFAGL